MTPNLLGLHFVDNVYTEAEIAKHMELLRVLNPAWINVLGGAQHKEALGFARTVRRDLPGTRVIFRHWKDQGDHGDNGMHTRLTASEWWEQIGSQYVGMDLTILSDNESMSADLTVYANWQAAVMTLAGAYKVSIAYGRFATHNPPKAQFKQLDSMFRAAARFGSLHIYSPNVYFDELNDDGHEYPFLARKRCLDVGIQPPEHIVIGEYAYARALQAYDGYKSNGIDGAVYIKNLLIPRFNKYFAVAGISACIYSLGKWPMGEHEDGSDKDTFGLDDTAIKALKESVAAPPVVIPPTKPAPVPKPTNAGDGDRVIVTPPSPVLNFRDGPNENYTKLGEIKPGQEIKLYRDTKRPDPDNTLQHWYWFESDKGAGWVADVNDKVKFDDVVIIPPPPPPITMIPVPLSKLQHYLTVVKTEAERVEKTAAGYRENAIAMDAIAQKHMTSALELRTLCEEIEDFIKGEVP